MQPTRKKYKESTLKILKEADEMTERLRQKGWVREDYVEALRQMLIEGIRPEDVDHEAVRKTKGKK